MEYVHLGRTGLKVSRLCLGTMNFGNIVDDKPSHEIMDQALAEGINFFDTANVYGWKRHSGATEEVLGAWFAQGGGRREKVVLATKVYGDMEKWPNFGRLSALNIRRACEASLRRLRTEYIDLYQFHHVDRDTPWEEIWQAVETLVAQGKILYAGSSNFAGWHIVQANEAARRRNYLGLVSEQCKYSLAARTVELEVLPACEGYGLGVIPWSPLAGGMLAGVLAKQRTEGRRAGEKVKEEIEAHRGQLEAYEKFCGEIGHPPAEVALAWLLAQPAVTAPIIGPRTMEQLAGNLKSLAMQLDETALGRLDEIWPGPGGPGPEAWAW